MFSVASLLFPHFTALNHEIFGQKIILTFPFGVIYSMKLDNCSERFYDHLPQNLIQSSDKCDILESDSTLRTVETGNGILLK